MATKTLATWALALQINNLTTPVIDMATKSLHNWAGCAIGGYSQTVVSIVHDTILPFATVGNSSILAIDGQHDAQFAALINGVASHADDYDDTHADTSVHPSGPIASAILALAEWKGNISGEQFLVAFVAGLETEMKLGLSVWPEHYYAGWHITSTVGSIGSAVACGKLLGLTLEEMQYAISTAAIQVIGMHESFGTDQKPFHVGRAAQSGLISAVMAKGGFKGSLHGLEAELGWVNVVSTRNNVTGFFDTLGDTWETQRNTFKPFPCDRVMHAPMGGWIQIHDKAVEQGLDLTSITNVTARTNPRLLFLTDDPDPQTGLAGKFSIYHAAAVSLLYGQAFPSEFTDDVVQNATVKALSKKVTVTSDEAVKDYEAFVTATFGNGTTFEVHIEHAIGSFENPLSEEFLKTKFLDQVSNQIGSDRAQKAHEAFVNIAGVRDIRDLVLSFKQSQIAKTF